VARARQTASDQLTSEVLELIRSDQLASGDRLPTVAALAARFAVAAPTMREALRRLQALGVVNIRHGSGVYVREPGQRVIISNPYTGQLDADVIFDLIEARLLIEPYVIRLAVDHADEKGIEELEEILARAEAALHGPDPVLGGLNLDFHRAIARLSGNTVLAQTIDSILDLYASEQMAILQLYDNREQDYAEHQLVLEAIRSRRPDLASDRMRDHLAGVRVVLEDRLRPSDARGSAALASLGGQDVMTKEGASPPTS
jgi:GntR family transcriptional repressor for pyruvate dehydrogenase complex